MGQQKTVDAWERGAALWHIAAVVTQIIAVVIAMLEDTPRDSLAMAALMVIFAAWYAFGIHWTRTHHDLPPRQLALYILPGWLIWFALTFYSFAFMFLLFILIPQLFRFLTLQWAIPLGIMLNTLILARFQQSAPELTVTWAVLTSIMLISSVVFAQYISGIIHQSAERKALIAQLEAARQELAAAERKSGILQERQRLAHEIHDTLAQGFTSILMHLETAARKPDAAAYHLEQAQAVARASLDDTRSVILALRSDNTPDNRLEDAVQQIVSMWSLAHKIRAEVTVTGIPVILSAEVNHAVLRIIQEALANIWKHAQASRVDITLTFLDDALMVDVQDDGVGFEPNAAHPGFGLAGMRERAAKLHGRLIVESAAHANEGTTIALYVPLGEPHDTPDSDSGSG